MGGTNRGGRESPPAANPMPPLDRATRDALTESIREHGVIVPIVRDQTGYVLDGHNRLEIAESLGVTAPEVIHECSEEQRDVLRIELNGARRQLHDDQWKPLVDHLRALSYSDRVIAKAVGVSRDKVKRYRSPESTTGASAPVVPTKSVGEDGKVRNVGGEWTAVDRVLHLIRESEAGLTAEELSRDEILRQFSESTAKQIPSRLRDRGLIEAAGKRGRSTIWRSVGTAPPKPDIDPAMQRRAERLLKDLRDAEVRDEAAALVRDGKELRKLEALARAVDKEDEAARLAEEKRQAEDERRRIRDAEIMRDQPAKTLEYWQRLPASLDAATEVLARYLREFEMFPPMRPADLRRIDEALERLRQQLHRFDTRLHPNGQRPLADNVIDL